MRDAHLKELLTLRCWDQLAPSEQEEAAAAVASRLPEPFRFDGLETHELGQQRHRVAFYTWNEARFALIPGGPATLGYEPGSFIPTEAHLQSWEETCRNFPDIAQEFPTLESYLEKHLTPLRQVTLQPFLLEAEATGGARIIIEDGRRVGRHYSVTYPQVQERIAQEGLRFPTSDEWEYACAAGARTLWRWGDDCPMIDIPLPHDPKPMEWDLHLRPNAFGLLIGDDPADLEFTAELGVFRGGDSGTALHVGPGRFVEWLLLASSFEIKWRVPKPDWSYWYRIRRAYSLFQ